MSKEYRQSHVILLLVVLLQFLPAYFGEQISLLVGFSSPSQAEFAGFCCDVLTAIVAVLLCRRWCPDVWKLANAKLSAKRRQNFFGHARFRKAVGLSSACILALAASGLTMTFQFEMLGAHSDKVGFERTERFVESSRANPVDGMHLATAKKAAGRLMAAAGEEMVSRWLVLRLLLGLMSSEFSVLGVSSLLFGLSHLFGRLHEPLLADKFVLVLPAVIAGLGFGLVYVRWGLWAAILFHTLANLMTAFRHETLGTAVLVFFVLVLLLGLIPLLIESLFRKVFRHSS